MTQSSDASIIMQQADKLATFSSASDELTRAYLTPEHRAAHDQLAQWMREAGLEVWQDSVGNQWGRKVSPHPTQPTLVIGSHSDTVTNAGKYDGNLGVLLGVATLKALAGTPLPFHVDVVAFADEEGMRFNTTLIGSRAVAGDFPAKWLDIKDVQGISMGEAMDEFGLDSELAASDSRTADELLAYLEVHIEQGPVLESLDLPVGVVTGIAGAKRYQFKLMGMAGHAGTVPHELRQDALCGAAQMISAIETFGQSRDVVATVGKCDVMPGAVNVIPGEVHLTLDIRSLDQVTLERSCETLLGQLEQIARSRNLRLESAVIYEAAAVPCNERLQEHWAGVVEDLTGKPAYRLPSGAGHDAMAMAKVAAIGMLFVRCEKGISHHPRERVLTADVAVALNCLMAMVRRLAALDLEPNSLNRSDHLSV
jgi:allantoate deiminase